MTDSPIVRTDRDDYSGDLIQTHRDGTMSAVLGSLHEQGVWLANAAYVETSGRPILDERGVGICGTCGEAVPAPVGPWGGETQRGGYSAVYTTGGVNITSVRCPRHQDFIDAQP